MSSQNKLNQSHFILESAILQEAQIIKQDASKAYFKMTIQTANEKNQNKRMYPRKVLEEAMVNCKGKMKSRAFSGEMDHPAPTGNSTFDGVRQSTVYLKEASHLILDYEWSGDRLIGMFETLRGGNGKLLLDLLKDKVGLGTSMRGMAELENRGDYNVVTSPLHIITYDMVSLPSHKSAVVNFNEITFESKFFSESVQCNGGTICTPDGKCYLPEYFDKLISKKIIRFYDRWV